MQGSTALPVFRPNQFDLKVAEHVRELVRRARELLQGRPSPDTFTARRPHEPFPREDDEHAARWIGSRELRPPE
jgi:hypothetical protein